MALAIFQKPSRLCCDRAADVPTLYRIIDDWLVTRRSRDIDTLLLDAAKKVTWKTAPTADLLSAYCDLLLPIVMVVRAKPTIWGDASEEKHRKEK